MERDAHAAKDRAGRTNKLNVRTNGYSVMEDAIDEDFQSAINQELDHLATVRPGGDIPPVPFNGMVTRRWFNLLNDGDVWQQVGTHPWIMQILPHVIGDGFLLSTMGSAVVGTGEPAQMLHVDDGVYSFRRPHPNLVCNTMFAQDPRAEMSRHYDPADARDSDRERRNALHAERFATRERSTQQK